MEGLRLELDAVRLLGLDATPHAGVRLRPAADGKNLPTAAIAYYTAAIKRRPPTVSHGPGALAEDTATEVLVGINASGGVAWRVQGRARKLVASGGMLTGTSGSGAVFRVATGAVACFGSEALWLVGGAQHPPEGELKRTTFANEARCQLIGYRVEADRNRAFISLDGFRLGRAGHCSRSWTKFGGGFDRCSWG